MRNGVVDVIFRLLAVNFQSPLIQPAFSPGRRTPPVLPFLAHRKLPGTVPRKAPASPSFFPFRFLVRCRWRGIFFSSGRLRQKEL
jgi:hypothetical protein